MKSPNVVPSSAATPGAAAFSNLRSIRFRRVFGAAFLAALALGIAYNRTSAAAVNLKNEPVVVEVSNPVEIKGPIEVQGAIEIVNDALKTPHFAFVSAPIPGGMLNNIATFPGLPTGKRLVVETLTIQAVVPPGQTVKGFINVAGKIAGAAGGTLYVTFQPQGTFAGEAVYVATHSLTLRINPATQDIQANIERSSSAGTARFNVSFAGYLED